MPPQINVSTDRIVDQAFELVRQQGLKALTARNLAERLQCSTRPIYRAFASMEELEAAVLTKARTYAAAYFLQEDDTQMPFLQIGLQYFRFAQHEPELFKLLYMSGQDMRVDSEVFDFPFNLLLERMQHDPHLQGLPDDRMRRILRDMWIYTHGLATLTRVQSLELSEERVHDYLQQMGKTIIMWEHRQHHKQSSGGAADPCCPDCEGGTAS